MRKMANSESMDERIRETWLRVDESSRVPIDVKRGLAVLMLSLAADNVNIHVPSSTNPLMSVLEKYAGPVKPVQRKRINASVVVRLDNEFAKFRGGAASIKGDGGGMPHFTPTVARVSSQGTELIITVQQGEAVTVAVAVDNLFCAGATATASWGAATKMEHEDPLTHGDWVVLDDLVSSGIVMTPSMGVGHTVMKGEHTTWNAEFNAMTLDEGVVHDACEFWQKTFPSIGVCLGLLRETDVIATSGVSALYAPSWALVMKRLHSAKLIMLLHAQEDAVEPANRIVNVVTAVMERIVAQASDAMVPRKRKREHEFLPPPALLTPGVSVAM